jgi:cellulose biosynthesis protein BcsQ
MASDYFIIPTSPDFFCYQAIDSLSNVFPNWLKETKEFKDGVQIICVLILQMVKPMTSNYLKIVRYPF